MMMMMMKWTYHILVAIGLLWANAALAEVMLYAPGSMADVMEEIAARARPQGIQIKVVAGHSPAQARQITEGAAADIFISADPQWMDVLRGKDMLAAGGETALASTRLVLVGPAGTTVKATDDLGGTLSAMIGQGKLAMADPEFVPAGKFAREALTKLGAWDGVKDRLALLPNVRSVVAMVERGEVGAGIGFASDVATGKSVIVTTFPAHITPAITFPIAIIRGRDNDEVRRTYDFVRGDSGMAVLTGRGFLPPVP